MKKVTIYTKGYCPYCKRACRILEEVGADFDEIDVVNDEETYTRIKKQTGCQTVPQVFIGDEFVGGSDDLMALYESGELKKKLNE